MDQQQAQEIARMLHMGGGVVGGLCGVLGAAVGVLAPRGKCRTLVLGGMALFGAIGVASLITGIVLAVMGTPYAVFYPLLLMGVILPGVLTPMYFVVRKQYQEAEVRRMEAAALRRM